MNRILIAEDEPRIVAFLEKGLQANGFTTAVAENGHEAILMAQSNDFDLLILDIGLPGIDGFAVLEELRGQGESLPIIILTVRNNLKDKVTGLEGGASDYVTKPFRFEELLARVRVQLRNIQLPGTKEEMVLRAGNIVLKLRTRVVRVGELVVELSAREFTLLETFLSHPKQVMSRQQLLAHVWGYDYDPSSNLVDVYVRHLRNKLGDNCIETVRGIGYRLRT